ncbi:epidermal retinol dehydrogenase 2 [Aplysia californica]|uniref:Epidermal retinol dehydrogenase 2 n=1 Tax=Aplysia californica TaxID=6500 RepID=A0ABM0K5S6_APLCA|nr:epidermal retinol dehydrogenase 2 [Aplysia californica]
MLGILLEFLWTLLQVLWQWVWSVIMTLTPTALLAKDVSGQLVLITGAGGGLGSRMALLFAELGCRLVLWDVDAKLNARTLAKVEKYGVKVVAHTVDLCDSKAVAEAAKKVQKEVGNVDILVNNAGVVYGRSVVDSLDSQVERTFQVNIEAHFWTVKAFLPAMIERNSGHVVSIASTAGLFGVPGMADYCSSKFAAVGLSESLEMELHKAGKDGVQTTVICPYLMDTGMFEGCSSRFPLLLSILDPQYVATKTVQAVLCNQNFVILPKILYLMFFLKAILPVKAQILLSDFFGATTIMDTFVRKEKPA